MIQCKTFFFFFFFFVTIYAQKVLFYSEIFREIDKKIHFSQIVKMAPNYAKIDRVGSLDAGFQQVPIVQNI